MARKSVRQHRAPWECYFGAEDKNKCRAGIKPKSDREYFEVLSLCILQAGLSWGMVRKIWPRWRRAFLRFDIEKLAGKQVSDLMKTSGIIKNERKLVAIVENAKKFKVIKKKYGSFQAFIDSLKTVKDKETIRKLTEEFAQFGDYSAEYYLHSVGYWK